MRAMSLYRASRLEHLGGRFGVLVIADHDARTLDDQLADLALCNILPCFVDNARLPLIARLADCADFVDISTPQMDAARADRFGQTIVGVVLMVRENLEPAMNHALRHRLRADVHQPPLVEHVMAQVDAAGLDCLQDILAPRHEQPDDGAFFFGHGAQNPFGLTPRSSTALLAEIRLPNQCIFAPVW